MNSIFSARLSIAAAVCLISSPTCFWWLPSSLWIAGCGISSKISYWMAMTYPQSAHKHEGGICSHWEAAWISSLRYPKHSWYSPLCLFFYQRLVWWDHQISWRSPQPELYLSVSNNHLDIPDELTIPGTIFVKELHFQWQQWARYIRFEAEPECIVSGQLNHIKVCNKNVPDDMDLVINFLGLRALLNKSHHSLKFLLAPSLESRRVMKDEPWVALEAEWTTNIVDPPLECQNQLSTKR